MHTEVDGRVMRLAAAAATLGGVAVHLLRPILEGPCGVFPFRPVLKP